MVFGTRKFGNLSPCWKVVNSFLWATGAMVYENYANFGLAAWGNFDNPRMVQDQGNQWLTRMVMTQGQQTLH